MLAIHVRKWLSTASVLLLILSGALPSSADTTTAGGGSGGLSEVQDRLEGTGGESPEIAEAKRKLLGAIAAKWPRADYDKWIYLLDKAAARPKYAMEVSNDEIVSAFSYLAPDPFLDQIQRILANIAEPESMPVNDAVEALYQTLAYKSPGKYAKDIRGGKPNLHLPQSPYSTPQLQHFYDWLSDTQKPLRIFKNDREFLMVQPSGACKLFADDTQFVVQNTTFANSAWKPNVFDDHGYGGSLRTPAEELIKHLYDSDIERDIILDGDALVEQTTVTNHAKEARDVVVRDTFKSDFKDMFEVRGWKREKRGKLLPPVVEDHKLQLSYEGLDGVTMRTTIIADPDTTVDTKGVKFSRKLAPGESASYELTIVPSPSKPNVIPFAMARMKVDADYKKWRAQSASIETNNPDWNATLERGWKDLYMLKQHTAGGEAIAAGTPWFASPFGRDELITSFQLLTVRPELARNVLRLLAHYQGTKDDPYRAEKPGKIMHELRIGEMARNKEIPFTPYYGTVDATPLWVVLLGEYYNRTGDIELVKELEPNLDRAIDFLQKETAPTGYLRYGGVGKEALSNQGWKDSGDSISYSNGSLAKPPIALAEVQAYLDQAWLSAAELKEALGKKTDLAERATQLANNFRKDFWIDKEDVPAIALDGDGKKVDTVSSNAGQSMLWNMETAEEKKRIAHRLMQPDMFSGYGIRTLSAKASRYFPNSYHNGTVWPHDVSLIAYAMHDVDPAATAQLAEGMVAAAKLQNGFRLPELFGGYDRAKLNVPIPYPVSCEPQAWAAGAPFLILTACTGIHINAPKKTVNITHPQLPPSITRLTMKNLAVGPTSTVALEFTRTGNTTEVRVLSNPDKLNINISK